MMWTRSCASIPLAIAILILPGLGLAGQREPQPKELPSVGQKAPDFALQDFKGKRFTLSKCKDREGVLLWFTNLCEGCRSKFKRVEELRKEYGGKDVEVIALSQLGKDRKTVEDAIETNHLTVPFLYDPDGVVTTLYSGAYVPGTCPLTNLFLINKQGTIIYATHYPGAPESEISRQLASLIKPAAHAHQPVTPGTRG